MLFAGVALPSLKTIALIVGAIGGSFCGALGLEWMRDLAHQQAIGQDPLRVQIAAYALMLALVGGVAGGFLALGNRGRWAATIFLIAGIVPGLIDPRAFVVTCVLVLGGILSFELRPDLPTRYTPRPQRSLG